MIDASNFKPRPAKAAVMKQLSETMRFAVRIPTHLKIKAADQIIEKQQRVQRTFAAVLRWFISAAMALVRDWRDPEPAKPVKPKHQLSAEAHRVYEIVKTRTAHDCATGAYYWSDHFMQAVCYIEDSILKELRKAGLIRQQNKVIFAL